MERYNIGYYSRDNTHHRINRGLETTNFYQMFGYYYVCPNDESLAEVLYDGLLNPLYYPSLGRWEDLLRIDTVEICDISEDITNDATITLNRNAYIPVEYYNSDDYNYKITGTRYRINKSYAINPKTKFRHWNEQIDVIYASPQSKIVKGARCSKDSKGYAVFLA